MFTIRCTTCNANLAVKSEDWIGQIQACPKCGSMVLIERPADGEALLAEALEQVYPEPEPERLSPPVREQAAATPLPPPVPEALTDRELNARKVLVGVLAGCVGVLLAAVGVLLLFKGEPASPVPVSMTPDTEAVAVPPPAPPLPEPPPGPKATDAGPVAPSPVETTPQPEPSDPDPPTPESRDEVARDKLAELMTRSPKVERPEPERKPLPDAQETPLTEIRTTADLLSRFQKKLPGLVEPSAALTLDVPARLQQPVLGLQATRTPLLTIVRTLSRMTEIPMSFALDEFRCRGILIDVPLTEHWDGGPVGDVLAKILGPLGLEPVVEERQLSITVPAAQRNGMQEKAFDVSDLVEGTKNAVDIRGRPDPDGPLTPERLETMLRRLVLPTSTGPESEDSASVIRREGTTLVVRARLRLLDESLRLLEQLRVIRGLPQTTPIVGEALVPETFGWDAVDVPMTLNYYQPTPLAGVLDQIEATTKLRILVDHRSLHRALCPLSTLRATVRCDKGTVNEALEKLLASVDTIRLTYRIVGPAMLEVTTSATASRPEKMSVEVHRFETPDSPLPDGETPEDLVRTIRAALAPSSWYDPANPETSGGGDVVIDRPSGCLIVRQSQPVQRQLRQFVGRANEPRPAVAD